ncbi:MAG: transposase zinc-binding domain-containing protein [Saprospiraceae bacterium]|nr:transposase zinc-binding domain-containing protein [Candidatus Parvibacillus calidus]
MHQYRCDDKACGHIHLQYHSCGDRHCPHCGGTKPGMHGWKTG